MNTFRLLFAVVIFASGLIAMAAEADSPRRLPGVDSAEVFRAAVHALQYQNFFVNRIDESVGLIEAYRMEKTNSELGALLQVNITIREVAEASTVRFRVASHTYFSGAEDFDAKGLAANFYEDVLLGLARAKNR